MPDILSVQNLTTGLSNLDKNTDIIRNISISVPEGEVVCIVGESGSGKSMMSLSIMGLLPSGVSIKSGRVLLNGMDLTRMTLGAMQQIRGNEIGMIFQEPMTALDPVFTVGYQVCEPLRIHQGLSKPAARDRAEELLALCGISIPRQRMRRYPHELSGGMRQRVMIAMALGCNPRLLIADEPTTALDVTIQSEVLSLILDLKDKFNTGILFITHDMGVVAEVADRVVVMRNGEVVEQGDVVSVFKSPQNAYTKELLAAAISLT